jgi:hypothetical protein
MLGRNVLSQLGGVKAISVLTKTLLLFRFYNSFCVRDFFFADLYNYHRESSKIQRFKDFPSSQTNLYH